uniref:Uncharacterized protein n=1 Tax=Tanacetum cinerariifolium TaxID=118510 RepID=A0A6L2NIS7_TANCI|nr:hypothetical protein [Tanacetum cinerariifolium]
MSELPDDAIRVYHGMFKFSGVQIPFSTFLFLIIKYYKVHFSPLGHPRLNKVATFEVLYRNSSSAIDDLKPPAGSYSQHDGHRLSAHIVQLRDIPEEVLILSGLSWVWKSQTRYLVIKGFGGNGTRGNSSSAIDDLKPPAGSYSQHDGHRLSAHIVQLRDIPEEVLILSGLSWVWKSQTRYLVIKGFGGNDSVISDPTLEDHATGTHSAKVIAKAEASKERKASLFGAAPSHVAKRTRSAIAQSPGSTTRSNLFADNTDVESNDDEDACVGIPLLPQSIRLLLFLPEGTRTGFLFLLLLKLLAPKAIMTKATNASPRGDGRSRSSVGHDASHQPTLTILTKEVFKDPAVCKTVVDQFPTLRGKLLARYRGLLKTHHEYSQSVADLNDKLSSSDAAFVKAKAKSLVRKFLASDEFSRVQCELLSLAINAGFERGLSVDLTQGKFDARGYFMQGVSHTIGEDVGSSLAQGPECVSFGPNDVVVALIVGEKDSGSSTLSFPITSPDTTEEVDVAPFEV